MAEQAGALGSYLDRDIIKQIEVRQKVQGRKSPRETSDFSEKDYQVLYHNAPWVCLRSSVDAPPVGTWKPGQKNNVTSDAAQRYILCGGTLEYSGLDGINPRLRFTGESNISNKRETPGYRKDQVMGYRPKPGITKVSVKTKDTFGCIMEATVDFMVYSRDDLELIDQIYFKPGMTALLEWGHTNYHDSRGNIRHMTASDLFPFKEFFGTTSFEDIEKEVQNWRKSKDIGRDEISETGFCGNYEVLFGYITNFSYSFNANGSYSCTVKILSKGSILEGLQIPSSLESKVIIEKASKGSGKDREENSIKTTFHKIFNVAKEKINSEKEDYKFHPVSVDCTWEGETDTYTFQGKKLIHKNWLGVGGDKVPIMYIQLNTFLHIVNRVVKAARVDYVPFEVEPLPDLEKDQVHSGMPYVSFNEHFSLNPGIVVLPTRAVVTGTDYRTIPATVDSDGNEISLNQVLDKTCVGLEAGFLPAQCNIIGDLWVNTNFILEILDGIIDEETQQYSLKSLIDGILEGIQKAMGNINSFGIQINEVTGKAVIVDRNSIVSGIQDSVDQDPPIIVSGIQTTVTNLRVTSEISAEISNEMSIAATAPEDGSSIANIDQVFWNEGCVDRHRLPDAVETEKRKRFVERHLSGLSGIFSEEKRQQNLEDKPFLESHEFLEQVYVLYKNFVDREASKEAVSEEQTFSQYTESSFPNLQRDGEVLFKRCVNRDVSKVAGQEGANEASYFQAGIIPIKVGFTMKGIGRFIIGSTFKISEGLVPRKYKNWRNIITGIEHNIDKGGWTTTVSALYYPALVKVRKPETTTESLTRRIVGSTQESANILETVLPTGEPLEQPRDTVEKFFRYFWENTETQSSVCARYVAMMAKSWSTGTLHTSGGWGSAGYVTADGTSLFAQKATTFGWTLDTELTKKDVSSKEVRSIISRVTSPGDIVVYYWKNPSAGTKDGYTYYKDREGSLQHVQMKMPNRTLKLGKGGTTKTKKYSPGAVVKVDSTWTTSNFRNYGTEFVYGSKDPSPDRWDVWVLHAPKINESWNNVKV